MEEFLSVTTLIRKYTDAPSLRESPFLDDLVIKAKKKRITVARGSSLVDENTGEITSRTEIGQVINVDSEQFIRLFSKDLGDWFDFEKSTQKVFTQMLKKIQTEAVNRDTFYYAIEDIRNDTGLGVSTIYRALTELINNKVIARGARPNLFFLNPRFLFNGDRADFVKSYRISKTSKLRSNENPNQLELLNRVPNTDDFIDGKTDKETQNGTS